MAAGGELWKCWIENNITADLQQITEQVNERDEIIDWLHNQLSLIEKQLMRYRELQGSS